MNAQTKSGKTTSRTLWTGWAATGIALILAMTALSAGSWRFGYDFEVFQMPIPPMVAGLVAAGMIYLAVPLLIPSILRCPAINARAMLLLTLGVGLLMRLSLLPSEPVLEDDYQRYLWDGAVTAAGLNPYEVKPKAALDARTSDTGIGALARDAGVVLDRVNHPELRSIYPPVTQLGFAAAHWLHPFSLTAWRLICLGCELAGLAILLALLRDLNRPALWSAIYWWNPIAAKELMNSAHMESLLVPLILGAAWLALRQRFLTAVLVAMAGAGAKLWPVLYLPLILRPLLRQPGRLVAGLTVIMVLAALLAWPILAAGLDRSSGFAAYAERWKTNSALFPILEDVMGAVLHPVLSDSMHSNLPGLAMRAIIVIGLGLTALKLAFTSRQDGPDRLKPFFIVTAAVFLLSPAQFPWYYLWVLPFLVFFPYRGLLLLSALLPLYYMGFYFMALGGLGAYGTLLVAVIWLPSWTVLAYEIAGPGPIDTSALARPGEPSSSLDWD